MEYDVSDEPIVMSKALLDLFYSQDEPFELMALYSFYYYTAKWQKTNQIKATFSFTKNKCGWGKEKLHRIKNKLEDLKLIENITIKKNGKITGHYLKVSFIWRKITVKQLVNSTLPETGSVENDSTLPDSHRVEKRDTNALSSNKLNSLNTVKDTIVEKSIIAKKVKTKELPKINPMMDRVVQLMTNMGATSPIKALYLNIINDQLMLAAKKDKGSDGSYLTFQTWWNFYNQIMMKFSSGKKKCNSMWDKHTSEQQEEIFYFTVMEFLLKRSQADCADWREFTTKEAKTFLNNICTDDSEFLFEEVKKKIGEVEDHGVFENKLNELVKLNQGEINGIQIRRKQYIKQPELTAHQRFQAAR